MNFHNLTPEECQRFVENVRNQGFAEGMATAKKEMGETLDRIIEITNKTMVYRFPVWRPIPIQIGHSSAEVDRPRCVELTRDQLEGVRSWLCGPPHR